MHHRPGPVSKAHSELPVVEESIYFNRTCRLCCGYFLFMYPIHPSCLHVYLFPCPRKPMHLQPCPLASSWARPVNGHRRRTVGREESGVGGFFILLSPALLVPAGKEGHLHCYGQPPVGCVNLSMCFAHHVGLAVAYSLFCSFSLFLPTPL